MRPAFIVFCLTAWLVTPACDDALEPVPLGWGDPRTLPGQIEIDLGFSGDDGAVLAGTLILHPGAGPHPAVVLHFGSDRWTRMTW